MDSRRLYIFLVDLKVPFLSDDSYLFVKVIHDQESADLYMHSSISLVSPLDTSVTLLIHSGADIIGSLTVPLKSISGEMSISTGKGTITISLETNFSNTPPENSDYLRHITLAQEMHTDMENSVATIKRDREAVYKRIMKSSSKARNSNKSTPKKKTTKPPSMPEPPVFVNTNNCTGSLDKLSSKDTPSLVQSLIALQAKNQIHRTKAVQSEILQQIHSISDEEQLKQTQIYEMIQTNAQKDIRNLELFLRKNIEEVETDKSLSLANEKSIKQQLELRTGLDMVYKNVVKKSNFTSDDPEPFLKQFKDLDSLFAETYGNQKEINDHFCKEISDFICELENLYKIIHDDRQDIKESSMALRDEIQKTDRLLQEIDNLKVSIQITEDELAIDALKNTHLSSLSSRSEDLHKLNQNLISQSNEIFSSVSALSTDQSNFYAKLLSADSSTEKINSELEKNLESYTFTFETLVGSYNSLPKKSTEIPDIRGEVGKVEDDSLERELDYLSEIALKWTHSSLTSRRILSQLRDLRKERENEFQVMSRALTEVKEKFPIYIPDKSDIIDQALAQYLNHSDRIFEVAFIRKFPSVYLYGTKKTTLKQERNKLLAKVGGGFLPIDHFVDAYESVEKERSEAKAKEFTPKAKKLMGKWAQGIINHRETSPQRMRESLVGATQTHSKTPLVGVRDRSPYKTSNK